MLKWFIGFFAVGLALLLVASTLTSDLRPWLIHTIRALERAVQQIKAERGPELVPEDFTIGRTAAYPPADFPDSPAPSPAREEEQDPYRSLVDEGVVAPGFGDASLRPQRPSVISRPPSAPPLQAPTSPPPTRERILQLYRTMRRNIFTAIDTLEEQDHGN